MANPSGDGSQEETLRFRCADLGFPECSWEAQATDETALMAQIEQHGRDEHGMTSLDDKTLHRVHDAIRPAA